MCSKSVAVVVAGLVLAIAAATVAAPEAPGQDLVRPGACPPQVPDPAYLELLESFLDPGTLDAAFFESLANNPESKARMEVFRERRASDWAFLCKYKAQNESLAGLSPPTVVYFGDSITENWIVADPAMFSADVLDRGISGQTSPQLLVRFYQDVAELQPQVVHIMVGTNDIAGNTGPLRPGDFENNIRAMLDLASIHNIRVVLAGIPPSRLLGWSNVDPRAQISRLNTWLEAEANRRNLVYIDYAKVLADDDGGLNNALGNDGVHPNREGYARMRPLAERAVQQALQAAHEGYDGESPTISNRP
jgi:lysophospholipase L1-like esterase